MSTSATNANVTAMIHGAVHDGLAADAGAILVANLDETVLAGCLGTGADDLDATEATLVCVVLDMSGSMEPWRDAVVDAYNAMLEALRGAKGASAIVLSTWTFADTPALVSAFRPVAAQPPLGRRDYDPGGTTALFDTLLGCMTGLVAYGQQLADNGVPSKRILFVLTDGDDNASRARAADVRTAAQALVAHEAFTLAYAGFGSSDLAKQAAAVGFPTVVTTRASASELRRLFKQVSASVIRVSQAAAGAAPGFF